MKPIEVMETYLLTIYIPCYSQLLFSVLAETPSTVPVFIHAYYTLEQPRSPAIRIVSLFEYASPSTAIGIWTIEIGSILSLCHPTFIPQYRYKV